LLSAVGAPELPTVRAPARDVGATAAGSYNEATKTKSAHIRPGREVKSAAIVGNRFEGVGMRLLNESEGDVQTIENVK
jgi:hypothetical protein